jgi:hypothetical protein
LGNKDINVVTIAAWAGVGSPRLLTIGPTEWLATIMVLQSLFFGWSFYTQGSSGDTSSADEFLDAALTWFGDANPQIGTACRSF